MPDNTEKIEEIDENLDAGETSTSVDGTSASIDLEQQRLRQRELKAKHRGANGERYMIRRRFKRINLS